MNLFKTILTGLSIVSVFSLGLSSCKDTVEPVEDSATNATSKANYRVAQSGEIVLGKKLENPYTPAVMTKAFANVTKKLKNKTLNSPVRTTHYYVRFLPKDWKQYDLLKRDTTIRLSDIPLDYEVAVHGNKYHDKAVCDTCPTWQYVCVKESYKFNSTIRKETLASLYIPESDKTLANMNIRETIGGKSFLDAFVDEALILTKNYADTLKIKTAKTGRLAWNPSGRIQVFDTRLNRLIPLEGVRVQARRWFTYHILTTNANGDYFSPWSFDRPANYSLWFEAPDFDVRSGLYGQAWIDGPKQEEPWNLELNEGLDRFYAHVFRGAYRYHYGNIGGLRRPFGGGSTKYGAFDQSAVGIGVAIGNAGAIYGYPNIFVARFSDPGVELASDEVFSTTCHETAHHTHIQTMTAGLIQLLLVNSQIRESWATGVEWFITQMEYQERGIANYADPFYDVNVGFPIRFAHQNWRFGMNGGTTDDYTCLFIDLVDNHNQAGQFAGITTLTDNVSGYTLAEIQATILKHIYNIGDLRDQLKRHRPAGVTDAQIDELLNQF